ncbi:hypothetical protein BJP25_14235 [Actinokineospora bangkokensis]|uniref:Serine/threonine protein phosphatase n=1 Tax=Actinokineospora bangkokensis TaxID=1193682 RepID=A0A1Q9LPC0_9PSEU|nr:hypothetical protein BJP25_14235 [Actinokineospora bangkokensis]
MAEPGRVAALGETGLGAQADAEFDAVSEQVRDLLGVPVALVSLVDTEGQHFPGAVGLGEPWASCRGTPLSHSFCQHVVVSGEPLVVEDAREHPVLRYNEAIVDLGVVAYAGFPLTDGAGRPLGSLCAIDHVPRVWRREELAVLSALADGTSARLRLRISLRDAERERAQTAAAEARLVRALERSQLLLAVSEALTKAVDVDEVREVVAGVVSEAVGATHVHIDLEPVVDGPWPRQVALFADEAAIAAGFAPEVAAAHLARGLSALVRTPLHAAGEVIGALELGWPELPEAGPQHQVVLATLADYIGRAVERTRFLQQRITVAHQLQDAMLSPLPEVPGLAMAARYWPSSQTDHVGGDWYDAVLFDGGSGLAVTVGDITGHDLHAAAVMGQVRSMARQATWERPAGLPSAVVDAVERACAAVGPPATGSLVHCHLRPLPGGRWEVRWANAGHPPPFIRRADGTVEVLDQRDMMFGYPRLRPKGIDDHTAELAPGDVLLLHTDGLTDRRGLDSRVETAELAADLGAGGVDDLPALLDGLFARRVVLDDIDDDAVLVALRVDAPGAGVS